MAFSEFTNRVHTFHVFGEYNIVATTSIQIAMYASRRTRWITYALRNATETQKTKYLSTFGSVDMFGSVASRHRFSQM